jgi:hypothetical protein
MNNWGPTSIVRQNTMVHKILAILIKTTFNEKISNMKELNVTEKLK